MRGFDAVQFPHRSARARPGRLAAPAPADDPGRAASPAPPHSLAALNHAPQHQRAPHWAPPTPNNPYTNAPDPTQSAAVPAPRGTKKYPPPTGVM
jgi:hypothetical protein